jgi:hypothetical protein
MLTGELERRKVERGHLSEPTSAVIMWGIDPVVAHYKPTEPKPMNPLQKFAMYLSQVFLRRILAMAAS